MSEEEKSMGDIIEDEIARSGKQPNVSMIAFTATPKPTTLQLFGCLNEEGKKVAFDLYSMKQAIEEGFILDVLQNYVTYKTYFEINKAIEDDPELETIAAKRKIAKYIELHDTNIAQKVEIIIEHFKNRIMQELGGKAKAMVITSSRQAAVKYRNEFETYISKHGYTGIRALVAFSGKVSLDGHEYTEAVMNGIKEEDLPEVFDSNSYQVLLVANKYQTGFDQPKLCAMYVDKRLRGVNAVQTLSRLNRICAPYDKKTFVLDFKNEYEDIQASFAPFYTETILNETITPSDIRTVEAQVDQYNFLDIDDDDFAQFIQTNMVFDENIEKEILKIFPRRGKDQIIRFNSINVVFDQKNNGLPNANGEIIEGIQREYFTNDGGSKLILTNKFIIFEINKYVSFKLHKQWFQSILLALFQKNRVSATRTGIRYINIFDTSKIKLQKKYFASEIASSLYVRIAEEQKPRLIRSMHSVSYSAPQKVIIRRYRLRK